MYSPCAPKKPEELTFKAMKAKLDLVQYYDRFIPGVANNCVVLNDLLQKKSIKWKWTTHAKAVKAVITALTSADTLTYYDPALLLSLACDARWNQ